MGQLIRHGDARVESKDGECRIFVTLDLNLNVNAGTITVRPNEEAATPEASRTDTRFELPDFGTFGGKRVKFGTEELQT